MERTSFRKQILFWR